MTKNRNDIALKDKWQLDEMFTSETFEEAIKQVEQEIKNIATYNGNLKLEDNSLVKLLILNDKIDSQVNDLFTYAHMKLDEDNTNSKAQTRLARISDLAVKVSAITSFIAPELAGFDSKALLQKMMTTPQLNDYKQMIEDLIRGKAHLLTKSEENIIAALSDVQNAPEHIFKMLDYADITFKDVVMPDGTKAPLTNGNFLLFLQNHDRSVRKQAFENLYQSFAALENTLGATYTASVKKDIAIAKLRKFDSAIAMSLFKDNIDISVYNHLVSAVTDRLDLQYRYLEIRKRFLGLDELHAYDLYVPMLAESDKKISFEEGFDKVLEGLKPLGEAYGNILKRARQERWIDVYETKGKSSGAYSWGTYTSKPFILLNYQSNLNDVFTLAHELGHSMHSYFSKENQPYVSHGYSLFVAEVASTVNEALLMRYLLKNTSDKKEKLTLLNHFMEMIRTTVYRQTMFAEFERMVHSAFEAGTPLSTEALNQKYYALNQKYFGESVVLDQLLQHEWSRIPHFYSAYYVYSYATGLLAALAMSKRILEKEPGALEGYLKFLSAGSSLYPLDALKLAGIDMKNPEDFYIGLDSFSEILNAFEELMD